MRPALSAFFALLVMLAGVAVAAAQQAETASAKPGIAQLSSCVASKRHLNALFLVDESGSLQTTDPQNRRVQAIRAALQSLRLLTAEAGGSSDPITVDASLAGFGSDFHVIEPWQPLGDPDSWAGSVEGLARQNTDIDTDYFAALDGARRHLSTAPKKSSSGDGCSAVFWFTDGAYDIEPRTQATADKYGRTKGYAPDIDLGAPNAAQLLEERGQGLLCQQAGVVDQLRSTGVHIVAHALSPQIEPGDRDRLQAISEGRGGDQTCGTVPVPDGWALGAYLPADDLDQLTASLFDSANGVANGTLAEAGNVPVCAREACASGTVTFNVDPGISSFNLLALTGAPGITMQLRSPDASGALVIPPGGGAGGGDLGASKVRWSWLAADSAVAAVQLPDSGTGPWFGTWSITFIDTTGEHPDAVAKARVYVFGGVTISLDQTNAFRRGETGRFQGRISTDRGGAPASDLIASGGLQAVVRDPTRGTSSPATIEGLRPDGTFEGSWAVPEDITSQVVNLEVTAQPKTASGLELAPAARTFPIEVRPPATFPTISPLRLVLPDSEGTAGAVGSLTIRGPEQGTGCVWLAGSRFPVRPAGLERVDATVDQGAGQSESSCLSVGAGQTATLPLRVVPGQSVDGTSQGMLTLEVRSDEAGRNVAVDVPVTFTTARPVDAGRRIAVFVGLFLIGTLLPLLVLVVLNRVTGRFAATRNLWLADIEAVSTPDGLLLPGGEPLSISRDRYLPIPGTPRPTRRMVIDDLDFGQRPVLIQAPVGTVAVAGARIYALWHQGGSADDGRAAPVPLRLGGVVLIVVADGDLNGSDETQVRILAFAETRFFDGHREVIEAGLADGGRSVHEWIRAFQPEPDESDLEERPASTLGSGSSNEPPPSSFSL